MDIKIINYIKLSCLSVFECDIDRLSLMDLPSTFEASDFVDHLSSPVPCSCHEVAGFALAWT